MTYDLQSISAPRLAGLSLHAFTLALESPLRHLLIGKLLADAGIEDFRARRLVEPPSVTPLLPVVGELSSESSDPAAAVQALAGSKEPSRPGFAFESAGAFTAAYREGRADPLSVAEAFLEAVAASESADIPLRAFIAQDPDDLLGQARASAERWARGEPLGPLDGVPVAVKDELDQTPYPTTVGTRFKDAVPTAHATTVQRLQGAGALLIGKANMHEIGIGVTGLNPHHGTPRNPYDPGRFPGGSSSGSAVAVAAGFCPIAVGADGGGSIRTPAAFCGAVGLKATWGRISEHGAAPLVWSMGHVGPIAATARDCALAYGLMAGPDALDPNTAIQPAVSLEQVEHGDLSGLRLGIHRAWFEDCDPEVLAVCNSAVERLVAAGAEVREVELEELELARIAHAVTIVSEMATAVEADYDAGRRRFGLDVRINLALARSFSSRDYVRAQQARTRVTRQLTELFEDVDVILTPTTGCIAPSIRKDALARGESDLASLGKVIRYVFHANLTGVPSISFPGGYTADGQPVGLMAMARPWEEATLLRLAHASEQTLERQAPRLHWRLLPQ